MMTQQIIKELKVITGTGKVGFPKQFREIMGVGLDSPRLFQVLEGDTITVMSEKSFVSFKLNENMKIRNSRITSFKGTDKNPYRTIHLQIPGEFVQALGLNSKDLVIMTLDGDRLTIKKYVDASD